MDIAKGGTLFYLLEVPMEHIVFKKGYLTVFCKGGLSYLYFYIAL
jgi:hypothetical protein